MPWDDDGGLKFAKAALPHYGLPTGTELKLLSLSENATYLVDPDGPKGVLRIYRPDYQTDAAKHSEIAWIEELKASNTIRTPSLIHNSAGRALTAVEVDGIQRSCVMFEWVQGRALGEEDLATYEAVGSIAARLNLQVQEWTPPAGFERMVWGVEEILGPDAPWGDWRDGPSLDEESKALLEAAEAKLRKRLAAYPFDEKNSGLVHCDLRAANILTDPKGDLWVIDFDDSGISWFLWDLCSSTTFMEHREEIDQIVDSWVRGYTKVRPLSPQDLSMIPDLVFLRRLHIFAWLGTHPESDLARELWDTYPQPTLDVARRYLGDEFLPKYVR